ncbi:MAG: MG2 domain-containing protein [Syntrophobacteraceae bacterium]
MKEAFFPFKLSLLCFALVLSVLGPASLAMAGSQFYLTAERSFSTTEKPRIRIDYTVSNKPMILRVLRPKSLEQLIEGQFQISRSYEEPVSELNLGHYFVKGLNSVESPLMAFRGMLSPGFRKTFRDTPLHDAIVPGKTGPLATPPEEVLHGPPAGYEVVREYYPDLRQGGTAVTDPGWWFGDSYWSESRYKIRQLELEPLPDGVYLVQAVQGVAEAQCLMQVSSLSVQVKQSSEQLLVRVVDRELNPISGAAVSYRDSGGKWVSFGKDTDQFGEVTLSTPGTMIEGKLVIRVQTGEGRKALTDTDFLPSVSDRDSVFIVTDRPMFKPGETFFFKGIVRELEKGQLHIPDPLAKEARITLMRADGTPTDLHSNVPMTDFGSFSGTFDLDEAQPPGLYRLVADLAGKSYGGEFRVRDYIKPVFYLEMVDRSPTVIQGEKFFLKFRARRYSGGVPKAVKFDVFLYRKKFEAPQWVVEAGGGLGAGTDYFGQTRSAASLMEPQRIYSSVEKWAPVESSEPEKEAIKEGQAKDSQMIDESGDAYFEFDVPKLEKLVTGEGEWMYTLVVRAVDQAGSQAVLSENMYVTLSEAQPAVQFSETIAGIGDKDHLVMVSSTYPDGKPAARAEGVLELSVRQGAEEPKVLSKLSFKTDDKGLTRVPIGQLSAKGRLLAVAVLETLDGKPMKHPAKSRPAVMIVSGGEGETIVDNAELELYTAGTILSPGQKAKILALLPAGWGKAESGTIWETISGSRIHQTRSTSFKGRSRWFEVEAKPEYGTGFYHTVTVPVAGGKFQEQTLGFRIVPRDKLLSIGISPERAETEPLKPFRVDFEVKDSTGQPAAQTELAVTVVDRAVYAVQAEIRPPIFDFFYPLPKLNLATFYSDQLQGYGYADILKKPNFRLSALKSQSKPTKKALRDTAGFFPHVVTDENGRASVTLDMPANVTEWLITAIATDRGGRVGESRNMFRTLTDTSVEVFSPQFMREGESASILVKTINYLPQDIKVKSTIELTGSASTDEPNLAAEFAVEQKGEHISPLTIRADAEGKANLKIHLEAGDNVRVGGAEEFEIPVKPSAMGQTFASVQQKDMLAISLPDAGKARELKVQVTPGLLGAALNAAKLLVSYPYGCTEQLVHSTIPNLVLMEIAKKAGISSDQLGPLGESLIKAERNAGLGIKKIRLNQKDNGGFGLWPSDPAPSFSATVTALYALKFASELKVEGAPTAYNRGTQWLSEQVEKGYSERDWMRGYGLSRLAELNVYPEPWTEQIEFVEALRENPDPPVLDLIYGLRILSGFNDSDWGRFSAKYKGTAVKQEIADKLKAKLGLMESPDFEKAAKENRDSLEILGFGFRAPYLVSAAMGALDDNGLLTPELESKLKRVIISYLKNGYWGSTFDTAQVILNSQGVLNREAAAFSAEREAKSRSILVRGKDGKELGRLDLIPTGFVGSFRDPAPLENLSQLSLEGLKEDEIPSATVLADIPFSAIQPQSRGITIERTFRKIVPNGSELLDLSRPLRKGDLVVSELQVRRPRMDMSNSNPGNFIVVEDGVPSLALTVQEDEKYLADAKIKPKDDSYWATIKETQRHPDKTVRIAEVRPGGELRIYQVWQVSFSGKASIPPARAFDMYNEDLWGNTGALELSVE